VMNISYTSRDKRVRSKRNRRHRQKERYIDYHAEAYYQALKRIEEEKQNVVTEEVCVEKEERTTIQTIMLFLKLVFRPGSLNTEFKTRKFADTFLNFIVSGTLSFTGVCLRVSALVVMISGIWGLYKNYADMTHGIVPWLMALDFFLIAIVLALFGGLFKIAGKELSEMDNPERLYAYSSGIMAALAVIIAIIGLFI